MSGESRPGQTQLPAADRSWRNIWLSIAGTSQGVVVLGRQHARDGGSRAAPPRVRLSTSAPGTLARRAVVNDTCVPIRAPARIPLRRSTRPPPLSDARVQEPREPERSDDDRAMRVTHGPVCNRRPRSRRRHGRRVSRRGDPACTAPRSAPSTGRRRARDRSPRPPVASSSGRASRPCRRGPLTARRGERRRRWSSDGGCESGSRQIQPAPPMQSSLLRETEPFTRHRVGSGPRFPSTGTRPHPMESGTRRANEPGQPRSRSDPVGFGRPAEVREDLGPVGRRVGSGVLASTHPFGPIRYAHARSGAQ